MAAETARKTMIAEIPENMLMMLKAMSAQTVTSVAADFAPKLDLLTSKIDENNKAMHSHMDDVVRKLKIVEEQLGDVEEEVIEKLFFQRNLDHIQCRCGMKSWTIVRAQTTMMMAFLTRTQTMIKPTFPSLTFSKLTILFGVGVDFRLFLFLFCVWRMAWG